MAFKTGAERVHRNGHMDRTLQIWLAVAILTLLAVCTGIVTETPEERPSLALDYQPKTMAGAVTEVRLTVTAGPDTLLVRTYPGAVLQTDTLSLPILAQVRFSAGAYDGAGNMIYAGREDAAIGPEDFGQVTLVMRPVFANWTGPFVGFVPGYAVAAVGSTRALELVAGNVDSLMGFTCQIAYDPAALAIDRTAITAGSWFGDSAVTVFSVDADTISFGITRRDGQAALSGTGTLGWLTFTALTPGTDTVRVTDGAFRMTGPDGNSIAGIGLVTKGEAVVEVR